MADDPDQSQESSAWTKAENTQAHWKPDIKSAARHAFFLLLKSFQISLRGRDVGWEEGNRSNCAAAKLYKCNKLV